MKCDHPEDQREVRRFRFTSGSYFALQCQRCGARLGRKLDPMKLGVPPRMVSWAISRRSVSGLGGQGNSKRRAFSAYFRSPEWKKKRRARLEMDSWTCQNCGEPGDQVHHLRYPQTLGEETLADLATSCRDCNLAERSERITRSVI